MEHASRGPGAGVMTLEAIVALGRETLVVTAFASLMVAGTVLAWAAVVLLLRERRRRRATNEDPEY